MVLSHPQQQIVAYLLNNLGPIIGGGGGGNITGKEVLSLSSEEVSEITFLQMLSLT